jgi:hypothetical protein
MSKIQLMLVCIALLASFGANAQEPCDSYFKHIELYQTNPTYHRAVDDFETHVHALAAAGAQGERVETLYTIPVVVHVIHLGEPVGTGTNISDAQVQSAITAINQDYRHMAGTNGYGAGVDMNVQFCLASRDPNGQPSNGINRVNGTSVALYSTNGISGSGANGASETAVKALSTWPRDSYVNVWIVSEIDNNDGGSGTQGYAYFPFNSPLDGIVILAISSHTPT